MRVGWNRIAARGSFATKYTYTINAFVNGYKMTLTSGYLFHLRCPGHYCSRIYLGNERTSDCGSCPSGTRVNLTKNVFCQPCRESPSSYDWMYLFFMATVPLLYHTVYIDLYLSSTLWLDHTKRDRTRNNRKMRIVLNISAILEVVIAAGLALLAVEPWGQLMIRSCRTKWLSDWYTVLYNPSPDYRGKIRCAQEAVFPLYSMGFIFYLACTVLILTLRPSLCAYFGLNGCTYELSVYAGLWVFPFAAVIHAVLGGVVYMTFPFIVIFASVISNAIHFATAISQSAEYLIKKTLYVPRNILIIAAHWVCHGFGIVAITQLSNPIGYAFLLLIPLPTVFYIATTRLTEPSKILIR